MMVGVGTQLATSAESPLSAIVVEKKDTKRIPKWNQMAKVPKYVRRKYLPKRNIQIILSPNPFGVFHLVKTDCIS